MDLIGRFHALKTQRITKRGKKYLLPPDKKDSRWGIHHFGGCEPITVTRAEKLIAKMEKWQSQTQDG